MNSPTDGVLKQLLQALGSEDALKQLLQALDNTGAERADRLLKEAVAEAESEVHTLIKSAAEAALLQGATVALERDMGIHEGAAETAVGDRQPEPSDAETVSAQPAEDEARLSSSQPKSPDAETASATQGCYLYGIVAADHPGLPPVVRGVHPASPVSQLREGALQVLVSLVPLAEFQPEGNAKPDLEWLAVRATAHDDVLALALDRGAVIPFRFGTIVRMKEDAQQFLARHQEALVPLLDSLRGKREWGVKIERRIAAPTSGDAEAPERVPLDAPGGAAYLRRRQREQVRQGQARQNEQAFLQRCHEQLGKLAAGAALLPLRAMTQGAASLVFNGAYLVADNNVARFHNLVRSLAAKQEGAYAFQVTGPWPPYNFVNQDLKPGEPS